LLSVLQQVRGTDDERIFMRLPREDERAIKIILTGQNGIKPKKVPHISDQVQSKDLHFKQRKHLQPGGLQHEAFHRKNRPAGHLEQSRLRQDKARPDNGRRANIRAGVSFEGVY
jgi:hypothetical protein